MKINLALACQPLRQAAMLLLCLLSPQTMANGDNPEMADPRKVFDGEQMPWLQAVGQLQVPGQRQRDGHTHHYLEDCSATLVAQPGSRYADTIITAWHCLELYRDLSRPITYTAQAASGKTLRRQARRLADGGGIHADWAILRLDTRVYPEDLVPLELHPGSADSSRPVTMAGYSRDKGLGERGEVLTYDEDCAITGRGETDCTAFRGASGGAVIQLSVAGTPQVLGVVSQGNGQGVSTYVPLTRFRRVLLSHLR